MSLLVLFYLQVIMETIIITTASLLLSCEFLFMYYSMFTKNKAIILNENTVPECAIV